MCAKSGGNDLETDKFAKLKCQKKIKKSLYHANISTA